MARLPGATEGQNWAAAANGHGACFQGSENQAWTLGTASQKMPVLGQNLSPQNMAEVTRAFHPTMTLLGAATVPSWLF